MVSMDRPLRKRGGLFLWARMDDIDRLKTEIQRIAWTTDPQERIRLKTLKLRLFRLCAGDTGAWPRDYEDIPDRDEDLMPYHAMAQRISEEDKF